MYNSFFYNIFGHWPAVADSYAGLILKNKTTETVKMGQKPAFLLTTSWFYTEQHGWDLKKHSSVLSFWVAVS